MYGLTSSLNISEIYEIIVERETSLLYAFSVVMIVLGNMVVLALVLKCLFPQRVELLEIARGACNSTYNLWKIVINYIIDRAISAQG